MIAILTEWSPVCQPDLELAMYSRRQYHAPEECVDSVFGKWFIRQCGSKGIPGIPHTLRFSDALIHHFASLPWGGLGRNMPGRGQLCTKLSVGCRIPHPLGHPLQGRRHKSSDSLVKDVETGDVQRVQPDRQNEETPKVQTRSKSGNFGRIWIGQGLYSGSWFLDSKEYCKEYLRSQVVHFMVDILWRCARNVFGESCETGVNNNQLWDWNKTIDTMQPEVSRTNMSQICVGLCMFGSLWRTGTQVWRRRLGTAWVRVMRVGVGSVNVTCLRTSGEHSKSEKGQSSWSSRGSCRIWTSMIWLVRPLKERDPNPSLPCRVKKMMVPRSASQRFALREVLLQWSCRNVGQNWCNIMSGWWWLVAIFLILILDILGISSSQLTNKPQPVTP